MFSHATVAAAFEEHRNATEQLKSVYDAADGRELTAEERQLEERLNTAIDGSLDSARAGLAFLQRAAEADEARAQFAGYKPAGDSGEHRSTADVEREELRQLIAGERRSVEFRDLNVGTAADGGNTVPTSMYSQVHEFLRASSSVMTAGAFAINTTSGEAIQIPRVSAYSTAAIVAEAGSIGVSDPAFGQVTLNAYKYGFLVEVSTELLADSTFDVAGFLARQGGQALGRGINAHFLTGSGSSQPNGVDNCTLNKDAAAVAAITVDELIDLQELLVDGYQAQASWIMKQSTRAIIRKLKDSNGQYLWQPAITAGAPSTILGRPAFTDDAMAAATAGNVSVIYGDLSGYYARFAGPVRVERSDDFKFQNDQAVFRFLQRADGDIVDTAAIAKLTQAAS